ncbi:hypothetical protein [Bradyrhizobium retamae]|uniref:Scaffolding protein n=1 Tax=Bradyrhizobium retamae TaxID=1300035 RepID=A0A0R3MPM4_9BRAD|nr:hypothetical protein [Bradyrhizobium retamae]KRR22164.1 hypothetical protein CQ13_29995 [Bradyrhizobium retamae]
MTTEPTVAEKALAAQGATVENLDEGALDNKGAPKAPAAPANAPPEKKGDDEENSVVIVDPAKAAEEKAAAEKAAAEKAAADKEAAGPLKDYTSFPESPAANAAIELLKEAGVGPNAANEFFAKALKSGDLNDVDVAGLEAKLGKAKATLVMAGVTAHYEGLAAKVTETVTQVHGIFGGKENWDTVKTWAQKTEKADPAFKAKVDEIRSMLNEGGIRADLGAKELLRLYNSAPDQKGLGTNKLAVGDSTGTVIGTALSRAQYLAELKTAHARNAKPAEIKALDARRLAGKKAGI